MTRERTLHRWDLFWMLARTEFRLRDQGTAAGFLWTLLYPVFLFSVLYVLFTRWMTGHVADYPAYLLIGVVQWNYFASATTAGLTSLRRKAALISSFAFPKVLVVLSSVLAVLLSHLLEWAVLLAALPLLGVGPKLAWLALPTLIALETALVVAVSCPLSALAVDLRDLERVWSLLLYGLFLLTPVFYAPEALGPAARRIADWNPLAWVVEATRAALLSGALPAGSAGWGWAGATAVLAAAALALHGPQTRDAVERL